MDSTKKPVRKLHLFIFGAFLFGGLALYSSKVLQTNGPFFGPGDIGTVELSPYYFSQHLNWTPFPQLTFYSNDVLYPKGVSSFFHAWFLEMDYLLPLFNRWFGIGPWVQWYNILSVLVTVFGCLFWLKPDFGFVRSSYVALSATFLNFYSLYKYPGHHSFSVVHWAVINIVADFVCYRRLLKDGFLSLRVFLLRILFLLLALGQDLSYVAGLALTSFLLTSAFSAIYLWRKPKADWMRTWVGEWSKHRRFCGWVVAGVVALSWLYLPLLIQFLLESRGPRPPSGLTYYASIARWIFPWFSFLNPGDAWITMLFRDRPEGLGAASPGWTLLIPALIGLREIWKKREKAYFPILILLAMCMLYHPRGFRVLNLFPWFSMARVSGRTTVIFPVCLALLALAIPWDRFSVWQKRVGLVAFFVLATMEVTTAYTRFQVSRVTPFLETHNRYFETIASSPGEAIFDFPFCVRSGNGVIEELCPDPEAMADFSLTRFHGKKVVGAAFGRMFPEMLAHLEKSEWPNILKSSVTAKSEGCFGLVGWKTFDDFYKIHDFSGIQLHTDLVSPACAAKIIDRYGPVVGESVLPGSGRAVFLKRGTTGARATLGR